MFRSRCPEILNRIPAGQIASEMIGVRRVKLMPSPIVTVGLLHRDRVVAKSSRNRTDEASVKFLVPKPPAHYSLHRTTRRGFSSAIGRPGEKPDFR
jgi:hypothetical protein